MKKLLLFLPLLLLADVDPFKAGNLNSPNPYGLTTQEKSIYENRKSIEENKKLLLELKKEFDEFKSKVMQKLIEHDQSINDINTKLSGFSTLLNELDATKNELTKIKSETNETNSSKISELQERIKRLEEENTAIKQTIEEMSKVQNENFQHLSKSVQMIIDQLKNTQPTHGKNKKISMSPKKAFEKAKALFAKKKYDEAKTYFKYALEKKYLPATSAFFLGEIEYEKKNYKEALAYYKKSVSLYPKKATFTDKLLYHTGISFKKLNQKEKAKLTFKKLIRDFPKSSYAKLAKIELEK